MRTIRLMVSKNLFELFTDAIRAYSRETGRFQSFRSTVQHACHRLRPVHFTADDFETFREQYRLGEKREDKIGIWLQIAPSWQQDYTSLRESLEITNTCAVTDRLTIGFALYLAMATGLISSPQ